MSAAVLTAPAVPVVPADSLDADLVRLCTEGVALAVELDAIGERELSDGKDRADETVAVIARLDEMAPTISAMVPATGSGLQAKAAFVLRYARTEISPRHSTEETEALQSLLRDALRPRPVLASPLAPTPIGAIAARVYELWKESEALDVDGSERPGLSDDAAAEAMNTRQSEALQLMGDVLDLPAASLGDVVVVLDFAMCEAQGLAHACDADPNDTIRLKAIQRTLYGTCRAVAQVAGVAVDGLLNAPDWMARKHFPGVEMPVLAAAPSAPAVSPLATIADTLERANAELNREDAEHQQDEEAVRTEVNAFFDTADGVTDHPIATAEDVLALARICRAVWDRTQNSDCEVREVLDQKLHAAVIGLAAAGVDPVVVVVPGGAPLADLSDLAEIEAAAARAAASRQAADAMPCDGPDWDRFSEASSAADDEFQAIADIPVRSLEGARKLAAILLARRGDVGDHFDHGTVEAAALRLLENLAGGGEVSGPELDPELLALHDRFLALEAQERALVRTIPGEYEDDARDDAAAPLDAEKDAILDRLQDMRLPVTTDGTQALARMLLAFDPDIRRKGQPGGYKNDQLLWLLLRTMLGAPDADALQGDDLDAYLAAVEAGRNGTIPPSPDAAFLALCAETLSGREAYFQSLADRDAQPDSEWQRLEDEVVDPLHEKAWAAFRRVLAAPLPITVSGRAMAARTALAMTSSTPPGQPLDIDINHTGEKLAWRIVQLVAGVPADQVQDVGEER